MIIPVWRPGSFSRHLNNEQRQIGKANFTNCRSRNTGLRDRGYAADRRRTVCPKSWWLWNTRNYCGRPPEMNHLPGRSAGGFWNKLRSGGQKRSRTRYADTANERKTEKSEASHMEWS